MLAVVPVRDGVLPAGAAETIAECAGRAVLAGSAIRRRRARRHRHRRAHRRARRRTRPTAGRAPSPRCVDDDIVVLPASPDGRDLAPRLAHRLGRRLLAGAVAVTAERVRLARAGGLALARPWPCTSRSSSRCSPACAASSADRTASTADRSTAVEVDGHGRARPGDRRGAAARRDDDGPRRGGRIVGGGAGLDDAARFTPARRPSPPRSGRRWARRASSPTAAGSPTSVRSARPASSSTPTLYLAFGISGAVQHTAGLGAPAHVISVNTDPHCPMMQMADLADRRRRQRRARRAARRRLDG